jgi:hypothetical protein
MPIGSTTQGPFRPRPQTEPLQETAIVRNVSTSVHKTSLIEHKSLCDLDHTQPLGAFLTVGVPPSTTPT